MPTQRFGLIGLDLFHASLAQSVEHAAVNRRVVGSSPTGGAIEKAPKALGFWSFFLFKKTDIHHLEKSMSKAFFNRF